MVIPQMPTTCYRRSGGFSGDTAFRIGRFDSSSRDLMISSLQMTPSAGFRSRPPPGYSRIRFFVGDDDGKALTFQLAAFSPVDRSVEE